VINVDKNPAYRAAVDALKAEGVLPRRVQLRQCKYLNNVVEQDHRAVKNRVWPAKGYGSFVTAWRTLQGHRSGEYDSQGQSAMGGEGRYHRTSRFHLRAVWRCRLTPDPAVKRSTPRFTGASQSSQ
jgi:DDE domain